MNQNSAPAPLWTRDFTIITAGSAVSMFGNALSGFAMSLLVLDISGSTLLYAIYIAMYTVPQLILPIISGAILDRFSRKKMIYTLDFISAGLYFVCAVLIAAGWFSFTVFAFGVFVLGCIQSTYMVAYDSFYPLLISEGNYQKAYSVASVLETVSAVMVPVSAFLYRRTGLAPLLAVNGVCFLLAALMETQIGADEEYIRKQQAAAEAEDVSVSTPRRVLLDIKEGFAYLRAERGLLAVAIYFGFSAICGGVSTVLVLPWFRANWTNGEYFYILVQGMALVGRGIGGLLHYRFKIPSKYRWGTALFVYLMISVFEGIYLFTPLPVMMVLCFCVGIGGITSYTIRISATQSYVPDERKGRFNGAFNMLSTAGALIGEVAAGTLSQFFPGRLVLLTVMMISAAAALILIGGGKKYVAPIYNRSR